MVSNKSNTRKGSSFMISNTNDIRVGKTNTNAAIFNLEVVGYAIGLSLWCERWFDFNAMVLQYWKGSLTS